MSQLASAPPGFLAMTAFQRLTVAQYQKMIAAGVIESDEPVELLEGYLVLKMPRNPIHDGVMDLIRDTVTAALPTGWFLRCQQAVTLPDSQPEPDFAVVRGNSRTFFGHHPLPSEIGLLIEVANTSLARDRLDKSRIYARAGILAYWVINLDDRTVEVFTQPSGPTAAPAYASTDTYRPGDGVPLVLDGQPVGVVPAADLLP